MSATDNVLLAAPVCASAATEAEYDRDPALWPSVRAWKTADTIVAELRAIKATLQKHPTSQARRFQILRNKRRLLFAKKLLVDKALPPNVQFGLVLVRNMFGLADLHMPGDPPYDKRDSVTLLMEFSKFIGTFNFADSDKLAIK